MPELKGYRWMKGIGVAVALVLTTACAGPWKTVPDKLSALQWSVTTPPGWMHLSQSDSEMLSKNGPYLEFIMIQSRSLTKGFRNTRQALNPAMLPHEGAELIIDNLRSDPHIQGFRMLASEPAMIAGRAGFKLTYSYMDQHGVALKTIYYGVISPDRFFNIRYTAAQRYYFDKELPAFTQVLTSLRFLPI